MVNVYLQFYLIKIKRKAITAYLISYGLFQISLHSHAQ